MADGCEFLTSPSFDTLQSEVFGRAAELAGNQPESILYIENNDHRKGKVANEWAHRYEPLRLRVTGFNSVVSDCYEQIDGPNTLLDALTRRRLVDKALRRMGDQGGIENAQLYREHFTDLFTELEGDGFDTPEKVLELAEDSNLDRAEAELVSSAYETFTELRRAGIGDTQFTLSEAFRRVSEAEAPLSDFLPHVDVVVVSGFYELSGNQETFLKQLAAEFELIIALPLVATDPLVSGSNQLAADAVETYRDVSGQPTIIQPETETPLTAVAGKMYTPTETAATETPPPERLRWINAPTPDREVRIVAKRIRQQLADGVDPNEILVVIPGLISYQEQVADIFEASGIESVGVANKLLYQTYTGRAMLDLLDLCVDEPRTDVIARLATNPILTLAVDGEPLARSTVADLAHRLPTLNTDRLLDELPESSSRCLDELFKVTETAGEADATSVIDAVGSVFEFVNLERNVEEVSERSTGFDARMEAAAFERVDTVLDAIEFVAALFGMDDPIGEVNDALEKVRIPPPSQPSTDVVEVVGPRDAYMQSYSHLYVLGLTEADFPIDQNRPALFERIFDELPGISDADNRAEARYQFATLVSSADSVCLTTPETSFADEDLLESSILDELVRVTGIDSETDELGNATREDVQRALRHHRAPADMEAAVTHAREAGVFQVSQANRLLAGARCAANRSQPVISDHDGQLHSDLVETLHPTRSPYSPTQLRDYAKCGFAYYMQRVLNIEAPDEFHLEPQKLDLGSLVHEILEAFYRSFQDAPGEPVRLADYDRNELEEALLDQTFSALEESELAFDDVFYDRWVEQLLAGLGTPETNEYYGSDHSHRGIDRGLFVRFLDEELDEHDDTPAWFEVPMDFREDGNGVTELRVGERRIQIRGFIDRVGLKESDDGAVSAIVHDYKTGDPSTIQTIDGVDFQLPLYTLSAQAELERRYGDDLDSVDGQFYVLNPPTDVSRKLSLQTYINRYGSETAGYEQFLSETTPERVADIVDSIEAGAFQTTTLSAAEAGCRYCDYRDVCDVRHHQRQAVVQAMDEEGAAGYIPQRGRDQSFLDGPGGDAE